MENFLKNKIRLSNHGFLTFHEYIQEALYHPEYGYYQREEKIIGADGDFYTSSNAADVFGSCLGRWFIYVFKHFQLKPYIVELGAGTGKIAASVLQVIKEVEPHLFSELTYIVIDKSANQQARQREYLEDYDNVLYKQSLEDEDEIEGIVFSNEFFDAFPVHVIQKKGANLYEAVVTIEKDLLIEKLIPLENLEILEFIVRQNLQIADGQRIEIPLEVDKLYRELSLKVEKGLMLTIDYGYTNEEWHSPELLEGSLRGYRKHRMVRDILKYPGEMDITSHIHWDLLRNRGEESDWQSAAFIPQHEFLILCGILSELQETDSSDPFSASQKRNRAIRMLIDPSQMSSYFKALIQTKKLGKVSDDLFPPK